MTCYDGCGERLSLRCSQALLSAFTVGWLASKIVCVSRSVGVSSVFGGVGGVLWQHAARLGHCRHVSL